MKKLDIFIGIIILAVLAGIIFWIKKPKKDMTVPESTSIEQEMESFFNVEIPEDVEKTRLNPIEPGYGTGIATRNIENGTFVHVVLADLPELEEDNFYEGWLVKGEEGDEDFDFFSTGKMTFAKGGYLLEYESGADYSDYTSVVITLEEIDDETPETHILEGVFEQ